MAYEHIELHIGDTFARLTLNRPDRRNALSLAMMREMLTALDEVALGKEPVLGIEGSGTACSAGHDLAGIAVGLPDLQIDEALARVDEPRAPSKGLDQFRRSFGGDTEL